VDGWRVYNGSLYLNFFSQVREHFFSDPENNIREADERWMRWWGGLRAGPFNYFCGPFTPPGIPAEKRSACWVPGTEPGQPDCCVKTPQPVYNTSLHMYPRAGAN